jgi:hypothetical protein
VSSRQRIAESLLKDIGSLWDRRGPEILERLADEEPAKIAAIAYGILPKEAFVKVENIVDPRLKALQQMDADALAALGGLIDATKVARLKAPSRDRSSPGSRKTFAPEWLCQSRNL